MDWRFDGLTALVSIAAGKAADLVVLAGNPAKNIDDVERVETVFKEYRFAFVLIGLVASKEERGGARKFLIAAQKSPGKFNVFRLRTSLL